LLPLDHCGDPLVMFECHSAPGDRVFHLPV
jgi:hypothetical protein